jgi:UDP-N-acetylmuramoyl-tripeptide--D-alanyl-D-alanine ligase
MTISELYQIYLRHPQIMTDSRNCLKGSLFFALKGNTFDGNQFAGQALSAGADYAIIDDPACYEGERTILVDDALKTLQQLAQRHRKMAGIPVMAITGTNGKTTTKELIATVLSAKFNLLYTEGNLNNRIGVPLTLLRMNRDHEMAVIEMGASHLGDIKELMEIALPNYGIITNVGQAHLEGFGSFENIVKTKGELYDYIRRTKGVIFIRKEDRVLQSIAKGIEQITYGASDDAFASGHVAAGNAPFLTFNWRQQGKTHTVETHLAGAYNLDNVLAAVAVGRYFKIPAERISRLIAAYEPVNNRSQYKKTAANQLIIDAYNANPASMKAAIRNFAAMDVSPKALILGDMKELGAAGEVLHAEVIEEIIAGKFDKVYLCGEYFSKTGKAFITSQTTDDLLTILKANPLKNYHILIKGSRGMALEKTIDLL